MALVVTHVVSVLHADGQSSGFPQRHSFRHVHVRIATFFVNSPAAVCVAFLNDKEAVLFAKHGQRKHEACVATESNDVSPKPAHIQEDVAYI